jgi:OOP family OmpA-OmpF porin
MRLAVTVLLLTAAATGGIATTAQAQNPSADQIIKSLRPTGPSGTTRGIRPVAPSSEPAAPAEPATGGHAARPAASHPAAASAAAASQAAPSVNLTVEFATGSADLTPTATRTLDELGRALTSAALSGYRFRIEGHTDTVGTRDYNKTLSDQRAASVLDYLAAHWKVDRSKVETVGMGEDGQLVQTGPNVAEPRNRRVTVINIGA